MNCPTCGGATCVIDTRASKEEVRRRRKCLKKRCGHRFTTYERRGWIDQDAERHAKEDVLATLYAAMRRAAGLNGGGK